MPEPSTQRPAAAAPPASTGPSWLAAQGRLPLAFMGLALAWIVTATTMLVVRPELLALPHALPPTVALTHAWMLGFFVTVACGAVYQLVPVALSATLWSEGLGWVHFVLHTIGVPGMVISFWYWDLKWVGVFGSLVALGIACFVWNTGLTVKGSTRRDTVTWSITLSTGWILLTALAGLLLVANRLWAFIPLNPLSLLRAHAHLGLVGFFVTLLQGVGFQLIPMFTLGQVAHWGLAKTGLWFSQLGLIALVPALTWSLQPLALLGALAISVGLIVSAVGVKYALDTRKKRRLDPGLAAFLRGGLGLCVAGLLGTALILFGPTRDMASDGFNVMTYALVGILGGLLPCVAGMMGKVVPFLTWMRAYGPRVGRGPTPPAHALTHPRVEQWAFGLQQFSVLPLLVGAWTLNTLWLQLGTWILAVGVVLFVLDMFGIMKHLWFPVTVATSAVKPKPTS